MAQNVKTTILAYAGVAFILLGVLFGMNIMTFIFGSLGPASAGFAQGTAGYNTSTIIQNESLYSIQVYAQASDTQFSVISIAIILVILISLFLLFWTYFMGGSNVSGGRSGGSFS